MGEKILTKCSSSGELLVMNVGHLVSVERAGVVHDVHGAAVE